MASILFDCDSTLLSIESLEYLLQPLVNDSDYEQLCQITSAGMQGDIPFQDSLQKRLDLASPSLEDIRAFNDVVPTYFSQDAERLIQALLSAGHSVFLVSGGLKEVIDALARKLGIDEERVYAVSLIWDEEGQFSSLDPDDPMTESKVRALEEDLPDFERPIIAIGDGMTDARLKEAGIADFFIAYTEHEQRERVIEQADFVVENMEELSELLEELLC